MDTLDCFGGRCPGRPVGCQKIEQRHTFEIQGILRDVLNPHGSFYKRYKGMVTLFDVVKHPQFSISDIAITKAVSRVARLVIVQTGTVLKVKRVLLIITLEQWA